MSRIITNNYIEKLNETINGFENSPSLCSLVDFFLDEVQKDQNRKVNRTQKIFSSIDIEKLNKIKESEELNKIYAYINIIINAFQGQYLHIHLNVDLTENNLDNLISLFTWEALAGCSYDEDHLDKQISLLNIETNRNLMLPTDNNGHAINQIYRKRYGQKHKLKFIEKIKRLASNTQKNGVLLNLNASASSCVYLSDFSEFPESMNTYVNFGESLQDIYDNNNAILQNISTILSLFPAERGTNIWYSNFISENINAWNQLPGFNFGKVITITSGEKTPEALLEMHKQKKFQAEEIFTIFSFEL